jgi:hypothetical protein
LHRAQVDARFHGFVSKSQIPHMERELKCRGKRDKKLLTCRFREKKRILNLYPIYNTQPFVQHKLLLHSHCKLFARNLNYREKLSSISLNSIAANTLIFTLLSGKVNPLVQCISHSQGLLVIYVSMLKLHLLAFHQKQL